MNTDITPSAPSDFSLAIDAEAGDGVLALRLVNFTDPSFRNRFIVLTSDVLDIGGLQSDYTRLPEVYDFTKSLEENIKALLPAKDRSELHQYESHDVIHTSILVNLPLDFVARLKELDGIIKSGLNVDGSAEAFDAYNSAIVDFYSKVNPVPGIEL